MYEKYTRERSVTKLIEPARPCIPSDILTAFIAPIIANIVKKTDHELSNISPLDKKRFPSDSILTPATAATITAAVIWKKKRCLTEISR